MYSKEQVNNLITKMVDEMAGDVDSSDYRRNDERDRIIRIGNEHKLI